MRKYKYYHVTIQPYNCDGLHQTDYMSTTLFERIKTIIKDISEMYSIVREPSQREGEYHCHFVLHLKESSEQKSLYDFFLDIIQQYYTLTQDGQRYCLKVLHKTETQIKLCAFGYFTKSAKPEYYNFPMEDQEKFHKQYLELVENKGDNNDKHLLDPNKKYPIWIKDKTTYFRALKKIYDLHTDSRPLFVLAHFDKLQDFVMRNYKICMDHTNKKIFTRNFTEFLICHNIDTDKLEQISLDKYFSPDINTNIHTNETSYYVFDSMY